jgi:hypothetical protein
MKTTTTTARPNFRINADQLINFFGHGEYLVKYLGKCPITGTRLYDLPDFAHPEYQPYILRAAEHDMSGPDFMYSWMAYQGDAKARATALEMARKTWLPSAAGFGPVTAVVVRAATYFDKPNGNPYFKAEVYANGQKVLTLPRQYGQESQIKHDAVNELHKAGFIELEQYANGSSEGALRWADRTGTAFEVRIYKATHKEFYNLGNYKN